MSLQKKMQSQLCGNFYSHITHFRMYSSKIDWHALRPMILERIQQRAKDYPIKGMVPVATDVFKTRSFLIAGVSTLLKSIPIKACKFCSEVYIGEPGHLIKSCHGYRRRSKNQAHNWTEGSINDILVPVEAFHLHNMFQDIVRHDQRFDFERVPALLELCFQAGANISEEILFSDTQTSKKFDSHNNDTLLSPEDLRSIAQRTLNAWDRLRDGVQRLLLVYPVKVCKYCSEVHIGPSGHNVKLCGVFKFERWRGGHFWKKAEVDDLIPSKIVWRRRPQDPPLLLDKYRGFYGHAPAVVELCSQAGAIVPAKYFCIMKVGGVPQVQKNTS